MSSIVGEGPDMSRFTGSLVVVVIGLVALGCVFLFNPFSMHAQPPKKTPPTDFAADRTVAGGTPVPFEPKRAMSYLEKLCAIGPRISGTEGMTKQQELLTKHFEELGAKVELQKFTARQKSQKQPVEMANLIVSWNPDRERRVILCSHYDTRPIADQEPNPRKWHDPFVSANDGGSGVALLMELAHHMKDLKTEVGVDFVFFDGEEYIFDSKNDHYFFGSEHFGNQYQSGKMKERKYLAAVLLDMVGGKEARFPVEPTSWLQGAAVVQAIWGIAAEQKCPLFQKKEGAEVLDDHVALGRAGIAAIDIIDFSYPHWHRLTDVPENCSGETLEQVARVLSVWLQRLK
jgi:glutaminyl-peptide cyclotransferase